MVLQRCDLHARCLRKGCRYTQCLVHVAFPLQQQLLKHVPVLCYTGWRTKCHTIDCARNTFLLLQKHLTSGTELILIGWKIVPNEEHVQCDHRFASQPLANEPLHSSSEDLCRKVVTNARVRLQEVVRQNGGHIEHVLH